ncbi:MAG: amino acid adenylation domain-containing protein [Chroococcidiopsidaceae cyanobacterium CP_BM_ER_R8_30]|nr:amino acid adenylation domain-containing protein [Chroococcidiopsidaceae cyanobacterium CP_BM_ER_R8_30]
MTLEATPNNTPATEAYLFPTSFAQQRLWFFERLLPNSTVYNVPVAIRLIGLLNIAALEQALNEIVRRHETLRSTFSEIDGQVVQVVATQWRLALPIVNMPQSLETQQIISSESQQPFDLAQGPLLRAKLLQFNTTDHILLLTLHHIISDGWSMGVMMQELSTLYAAFADAKPSPLPELPIQYADFAQWQQQWLQGEVLVSQLDYWRQQLADLPALDLPTNRPRPAIQSYRGATQYLEISASLTQALENLSQQTEVTLFVTLLTAFQILLFRYTGQPDLAVGTPIANRNRRETEGLIGFFVNLLVIRTDLSGYLTVRSLLKRVRSVALDAYSHQDLPFERLVEELQPVRSLSYTPLIQVMFALSTTPTPRLELVGLTWEFVEVESHVAKFDLTLSIENTTQGLKGALEYSTDLFDAETIKRLLQHFQILLAEMVANPDQLITELTLFSATERQQLLVDWNQTQVDFSLDQCIHQLFETQAEKTPDVIALQSSTQQFTYQMLNQLANEKAHQLQQLGVKPEVVVGLYCDRSPELVMGMLAILKAGGAYVVFDPHTPVERLGWMLQDAQVSIVLTQHHLRNSLLNLDDRLTLVELEQSQATSSSSNNPISQVATHHLAYIIYTSGSTGQPKGVQIEHRGILNLINWHQQAFQIQESDRATQIAAPAFDACGWEIFPYLTVGASIHFPGEITRRSPEKLRDWLISERITLSFVPTSFAEQLWRLDWSGSQLRLLLIGGDALRQLPPPSLPFTVINNYGPTENTVVTTSGIVTADEASTIGRAIANTQLYVLDVNLQPVPIGVSGELYVGGTGLARGYLNGSAESFITNPFDEVNAARPSGSQRFEFVNNSGSRLYRTGDLVRYRADGRLEFLGRRDQQVKIRGFRIEPGEIERTLTQHVAVREAIVLVKEISPNDRRLVAYVVLDSLEVQSVTLQQFLKAKLPEYMIPGAFVKLDTLPLTLNGKIDRQALANLAVPFESEISATMVAPQTEIEFALVELWTEVLGRRVSLYDNFFLSGGHSLLATQLTSRIRDALQIEVPLQTLFESPTVAEIANYIAFLQQAKTTLQMPETKLTATARGSSLPLSFAQQRLWFLEQLVPGNPFYNVSTAMRLTGTLKATPVAAPATQRSAGATSSGAPFAAQERKLNIAALEQSFNEILRRHDTLRTSFWMQAGSPIQVIAPEILLSLPVVDLQSLDVEAQSSQVQTLAVAEAQKPFNLAHPPLLRVQLLQLNAAEFVLLLTLHHIISDGWSIGVLMRELGTLYRAFASGQPSPLAELPLQYADFAQWQRNWLQGDMLKAQLKYWQQQLADLPTLELPIDRPRPAIQSYRGARRALKLASDLTLALKTLSQQAGVTLFITLLAAFQTLLYRYTGQTDIAIGSPIANRNKSEIEGLIGFFVNSLVMRIDLAGNPTFTELLVRSRQVAFDAYAHQDLPFERLVEELQPERDLSRNPLFQVVLALQNASKEVLDLPGIALSPIEFDPGTTRFDLEFHLSESTSPRNLSSEATELTVLAVYNTDLFNAATIVQMLESFQTLLTSIVTNPEQTISELPILTANERQRLTEWNRPQISYRKDQCVHQLFELQAERTPNALAVTGTTHLTYRELNERSNQLAHYLQSHNVTAETPVGICVERSPEFVIGLLGILKAGGAYVPLDPAYPSERLTFMLNDAQVAILLTQRHLTQQPSNICKHIICLDQWHTFTSYSQENLRACTATDNLAYILYTSGSTGQPKGVLVEHRSLLNLIFWHQKTFEVSARDHATQVAGIAFDACGWELFPYLTIGASIHIPDEITRLSPTHLQSWLREQQITISFLPTPLAEQLFTLDWSDNVALRLLLIGGDRLRQAPPPLPFAVVNNYGLTETTVVATSGQITEVLPTIGTAITNTQLYILDANLQLVPIGAKGELYIGGDGLARGYLNRPELTAERFITNPFRSDSSRLYKTGDRVRYRANGVLEFVGRCDEQVKIRGYRIELGEIEAALGQHPVVQAAIVVADENEGDSRLIAYVTQRPETIASASQAIELQDEQVLQWQMLYEETYGQPTPFDPTFNIIGWNSSYTGKPLPAEQIQEWVDCRVNYILSLQPQRVLEIGCGTGLMLFRIAPHCTQYWGTDFSAVGLGSIQQQLAQQPLPQVKLLQRMATDFTGIESQTFDAVILNSVVQYFPSIDYLIQVIEGAIASLAPGGFIFLGDIRSLPLLQAFHTLVQLHQAEPSLSRSQLRQRVQAQILQESELVIDPAFFQALLRHFAEISHVQIELTQGHHHNEMTQFRYNVTLHIRDQGTTPIDSPTWLDWSTLSNEQLNLSSVQQLLNEQPHLLKITQIPNARISAAMQAVQWLENGEAPETVEEFRAQTLALGVDPEALRSLIKELPYTIHLSWSASSAGYYDALFIHNLHKQQPTFPICVHLRSSAFANLTCADSFTQSTSLSPTRHSKTSPWQRYANNPLQAKLAAHLVPQLRSHLNHKLPEHMLPAAFVVLESFPLTPNGKINRRALPKPDHTRSTKAATLPRSQVEQTLTEIWCDVLSLKQISIDDNFFELGGHSLLATRLVSRIRDTFEIELPLRSLFETPTIDKLATEIERLQNSSVQSKLPAILPLSREAYRIKLSYSLYEAPKDCADSNLELNHPHKKPEQANDFTLTTSEIHSLVPLQPIGSKPPFFCVHPIFGTVFPYYSLARQFDDRPFYGLQPIALDGEHPPHTTIEAMATYYIEAILQVQPQGPYYVGGWSFGGVVAFEIAQQLQQAGHKVAFLAILDTAIPGYRLSYFESLQALISMTRSLFPFFIDYLSLIQSSLQVRDQPSSSNFLKFIRRPKGDFPQIVRSQLLNELSLQPILQTYRANIQAFLNYTPKPYPNPINLFRSSRSLNKMTHDSTLGWEKLTKEVCLCVTPGNHLTMLRDPNVQHLGEELKRCLKQVSD